ncbi:MAG: hypothetical protein HY321_14515 [Armatimonadetes bacterium]|nr:hypothetical protein [Armatimonadota bacterium]
MTLTIDLPPNMEEAARGLAAARGKTVDEMARQVLAEWLLEALEDEEDRRAIREFQSAQARGRVESVDFETVKADWSALPD